MRLLNKFGFDEEAVSPVVGVILMVAITVILAAVIGTFVLDLGGQVQQNAQAGVTFDETEGVEVQVQLNSVQSADHIYVTASTGANSSFSGGLGNPAAGTDASPTPVLYNDGPNDEDQYLLSSADGTTNGGVGTTVTYTTSGYSSGQLTVIGVLGGSENILQTYNYEGGSP